MKINLIIIALSFVLNFIFFKYSDVVAKKINLYDIPDNKRKLHKKPIPINGGIFYFFNLMLIFIFDVFFNDFKILSEFGFINEVDAILTLLIIFLLLLLGIIDDKISIKPLSKSVLSIIIFYAFLSIRTDYQIISLRFDTFNFGLDLFNLSLIFTVLCFMIFQILLNMYDGINLQSASYYSIILIYLAIVNYNLNFSMLCILSLIYLAFFAIYNYQQKIFLGDNGIYIFSFILALLIIQTYDNRSNNFTVEEIFIILFVPTIDMVRLFFRRVLRNKNPLKADRKHLHHILLARHGLIKTNFLLIAPLILSILLINLANLNLLIIITLNFIIYVSLIKFKKR